ncbi:large ribosomal subunit protein mL49 [Pogona vitticeps]
MAALAGVGSRRAAVLLLLQREGGRRRPPPGLQPRTLLRWGAAHMTQASTEQVSGDQNYPGVVESTEEYKFVERLIPPTQVPLPPKHDHYPTPSGWKPPQDPPPDLPYFVRRSRMHNIPVYTDLTHACRKMTVIRKIEGDIWALEKDVKEFITPLLGKAPATQVNEVTNSIRIKGYFDQELKQWLMDKGF